MRRREVGSGNLEVGRRNAEVGKGKAQGAWSREQRAESMGQGQGVWLQRRSKVSMIEASDRARWVTNSGFIVILKGVYE
jgi:hypothetical protein